MSYLLSFSLQLASLPFVSISHAFVLGDSELKFELTPADAVNHALLTYSELSSESRKIFPKFSLPPLGISSLNISELPLESCKIISSYSASREVLNVTNQPKSKPLQQSPRITHVNLDLIPVAPKVELSNAQTLMPLERRLESRCWKPRRHLCQAPKSFCHAPLMIVCLCFSVHLQLLKFQVQDMTFPFCPSEKAFSSLPHRHSKPH